MFNLKQLFLALFVPLASALGLAGSYALFSSRLERVSGGQPGSATVWGETLTSGTVFLLCCALLLWWLASFALAFTLSFRARRQGRTRVELPRWVPTAVKGLVTGLFSLGLLSSPAFALNPTTVQPLSSVSAVELENAPVSEGKRPGQVTSAEIVQPSPFLPSVASPSLPGQDSSSTEIVTVQLNRHLPLSPLFGRTEQQPAANNSQQTEPKGRFAPEEYRVRPGDTLWSIAESRLPATASGADVLRLVYKLQETNSRAVPTLDTLIYPEQVLLLPPLTSAD